MHPVGIAPKAKPAAHSSTRWRSCSLNHFAPPVLQRRRLQQVEASRRQMWSKEHLQALTVAELRELCGEAALKKTGKKAELVERLLSSPSDDVEASSAASNAFNDDQSPVRPDSSAEPAVSQLPRDMLWNTAVLSQLTVKQLKVECELRGLLKGGVKDEIIFRLLEWQQSQTDALQHQETAISNAKTTPVPEAPSLTVPAKEETSTMGSPPTSPIFTQPSSTSGKPFPVLADDMQPTIPLTESDVTPAMHHAPLKESTTVPKVLDSATKKASQYVDTGKATEKSAEPMLSSGKSIPEVPSTPAPAPAVDEQQDVLVKQEQPFKTPAPEAVKRPKANVIPDDVTSSTSKAPLEATVSDKATSDAPKITTISATPQEMPVSTQVPTTTPNASSGPSEPTPTPSPTTPTYHGADLQVEKGSQKVTSTPVEPATSDAKEDVAVETPLASASAREVDPVAQKGREAETDVPLVVEPPTTSSLGKEAAAGKGQAAYSIEEVIYDDGDISDAAGTEGSSKMEKAVPPVVEPVATSSIVQEEAAGKGQAQYSIEEVVYDDGDVSETSEEGVPPKIEKVAPPPVEQVPAPAAGQPDLEGKGQAKYSIEEVVYDDGDVADLPLAKQGLVDDVAVSLPTQEPSSVSAETSGDLQPRKITSDVKDAGVDKSASSGETAGRLSISQSTERLETPGVVAATDEPTSKASKPSEVSPTAGPNDAQSDVNVSSPSTDTQTPAIASTTSTKVAAQAVMDTASGVGSGDTSEEDKLGVETGVPEDLVESARLEAETIAAKRSGGLQDEVEKGQQPVEPTGKDMPWLVKAAAKTWSGVKYVAKRQGWKISEDLKEQGDRFIQDIAENYDQRRDR